MAKLHAAPTTSYWLKEALVCAERRDPLDALRDAEALVRALKNKAEQLHLAKFG